MTPRRLVLAAALLVLAPFTAVASVPRQRAADVLATTSLERSLAREAGSLFAVDDVSLMPRSREAGFRVFAGDELGDAHVLVFELGYPETRVGGFGLPDEARVGADRSLRLEAPWACDESSPREATGSGEFRIFDPAGTSRSASAFGWNRLFQGREYLGFVDAYDFRARILWPELGRFGQEDPAKAHPELSPYEALGGAWSVHIDPFGLDWTPQARLERQELIADIARYRSGLASEDRSMLFVLSTDSGSIYNPADKLAASMPDVATLRYSLEEGTFWAAGVELDNLVMVGMDERLRSFEAAWSSANGRDNVYFDEESGRFALFDFDQFETQFGVMGMVGSAFDVAAAAGATAEARLGNGGYNVERQYGAERAMRLRGFQKHHIISDKNRMTADHELLRLAGFDLESTANEIFLPSRPGMHSTRSIHRGGHSASVMRELAASMTEIVQVGRQLGWGRAEYERGLKSLISQERQLLRSGRRALNRNRRPWAQ